MRRVGLKSVSVAGQRDPEGMSDVARMGRPPEQSDSRVMFATYDKVSGNVRLDLALRNGPHWRVDE